ncbi:MAG: prepilin-type N-terminal cleavage/methylation domain-containing protein [Deltaproteobacteria bacterium]|nr:prepilin-type N-terminal cleavage/methylation domain-containing protein [Deltaproteobacteria bacterium]
MEVLHSPKGFSLIELLITMGVLGIILAALGGLFTTTSKNYSTQSELINNQENARSTLDFMARLLRDGVSSTVVISGTSPNNTLAFSVIEDFGRSTAGNTATAINDATKTWTTNQWQNYYVNIHSGTGSGQTSKQIVSNTATQLTISNSSPWTTVPDTTSDYKMMSSHSFSRSGNTLQYTKNGSTVDLSNYITGLTAQLVGTAPGIRVDLTLSAQTANIRQDTGQTSSVTLNSSVKMYN